MENLILKIKIIAILLVFSILIGIIFYKKYKLIANKQKLTKIWVIDGDTINGTDESGQRLKIRLLRIDCHETSYNSRADFQHKLYNISYEKIYELGNKEKIYLINFIKNNKNNIYFENKGTDKYGRTLAELYIGKNKNINDIILNNNICPKYIQRNSE